jgi:hypothetical protein
VPLDSDHKVTDDTLIRLAIPTWAASSERCRQLASNLFMEEEQLIYMMTLSVRCLHWLKSGLLSSNEDHDLYLINNWITLLDSLSTDENDVEFE